MRRKNYTFDNCRAFTTRSTGGIESGFEGWLRIIAKGQRDFLPGIEADRSALVIVDVQRGSVRGWPQDEYGEVYKQIYSERTREMQNRVLPNIKRLQNLFRQNNLFIAYTTLGPDQVLEEIAPEPTRNEVVVAKYSSGAFSTSPLDNVLREHDIATLFFAGAATDGCVDATMSVAYDLGYQTILVEDACLGHRPELHEACVKIWRMRGFVRTTDQVVNDYPWQAWVDPAVNDPYEMTRNVNSYW